MEPKNKTLLKDALHNLDPQSGASDEYNHGLMVGIVSAIMAYTNAEYDKAIEVVKKNMPRAYRNESIPVLWRKSFAPPPPKHGYANMPETTLGEAVLKIGTDPQDSTKATHIYYHGFLVMWIVGREDGAFNFALENGDVILNADGNTTVGIETTTLPLSEETRIAQRAWQDSTKQD